MDGSMEAQAQEIYPTSVGLDPLAEAITSVEERVRYLVSRIDPVLMPESVAKIVEEVSGVTSQLGKQTERLRDLESYLAGIIARVDL